MPSVGQGGLRRSGSGWRRRSREVRSRSLISESGLDMQFDYEITTTGSIGKPVGRPW